MAEQIKRQVDLLAFTVSLSPTATGMDVSCALEESKDGEVRTEESWTCTAAEIGLPETLERRSTVYEGVAFQLPNQIVDGLAEALAEKFEVEGALWLHLRRPYGYLDMVPWERLLQPALGVPVLRLPEFVVDPPRESPTTLNAVLCSSLPVAKGHFAAVAYLLKMARIIDGLTSRQTTIDIFTDQAAYGDISSRIETTAFTGTVNVHDPADAEQYVVPDPTLRVRDPMGRLMSPWLLWMRNALKGRSVDLVHFATHGYYSQDEGALALAESPIENVDRRMARFVGAAELSTFLTHVGAWSVAFTSPERNYSQMGLRHLAHTIAQMRPGPVLHHDVQGDWEFAALADAYRFLFEDTGQPPASPSVFLYCHPDRLDVAPGLTKGLRMEPMSGAVLGRSKPAARGVARAAQPELESVRSIRSSEALETVYESAQVVPSWVVAAERYVEQRSLELGKRSPDAEVAAQDEELDAALETLRQIQQIVADNALEPTNSDATE